MKITKSPRRLSWWCIQNLLSPPPEGVKNHLKSQKGNFKSTITPRGGGDDGCLKEKRTFAGVPMANCINDTIKVFLQ